MPQIPIPTLDDRDEDQLVADMIDDLPAEISDHNAGEPAIKLLEAVGAYGALIIAKLNAWGVLLRRKLLELVGITLDAATYATVTLRFSRTSTTGSVNVPAGTVVKTGTSVDAVKFATDALGTMGDGVGFVDVAATAVVVGSDGNVPASTLIYFETPIAGVDAVTNQLAATGGQDEEAIASAEARAPLTIRASNRAITAEDFEALSLEVADVARVQAVSDYPGQMRIYVLAESDLNETPSGALTSAVDTYLTARTIPNLVVDVEQQSITLIWLSDVEVELEDGYTTADIQSDVEAALAGFFTAVDVYDADGVTLLNPAWEWGRGVTENELVALLTARRSPTGTLLSGVAGIKRVGDIDYKTSTNYGGAWSGAATLTSLSVNATYGLLHWGEGYGSPGSLVLTEL